jgi:hypothetical protein
MNQRYCHPRLRYHIDKLKCKDCQKHKLAGPGHGLLPKREVLGWELQFLVPISGIPIGDKIPIPFTIPKIPVGFFF